MKAAIVHGGNDLRVQDTEEPRLDPAAVILKVEAATICNSTDNKTFRAPDPETVWPHLPPPFILGHEACGAIVEKGDQVASFDLGDRVAFWGGGTGGFAEYFLIRPRDVPALVKIGPSIDSVSGAIMEMVGGTLRHLVAETNGWRVGEHDTVVIFGLGPSGILYLQESKILGARHVIAVGKHDFRMEKARDFGADEVMDYREGDIARRIKQQHGSVDMVIDTTGKDVIPDALAILRPRGTFVPFGVGPQSTQEKKKRLESGGVIMTEGGDAQWGLERGKEWIEQDRLKISPLVTMHVPLEEVETGLDACLTPGKEVLKIAVDIR